MKSALIFVIVSLCIFSQSHAAPQFCGLTNEQWCDGAPYLGASNVVLNPYQAGVLYDDVVHNPILTCCGMPCGTQNVYNVGLGYTDSMPASGTVRGDYFYFERNYICQRIRKDDIPALRDALEAEGSNIKEDCTVVDGATFTDNKFPYAGGSIHVDLLQSLQTAVSGWSSTGGCNL